MSVVVPGDPLDITVRDFVAGQRLFRRYTLIRTLGRGGMGVVWLARDEELERDVALKFLPELIIHDRAVLSDLKRETKRSLELTHKNIVRIYDFVNDEVSAAISMEYVDGDTLSNLRADRPAKLFEPPELIDWLKEACEALDYAHNHARVVHRDLKPSNLMVNQRGDLKVADFGISRRLGDSISMLTVRTSNTTSGTLVYMSPQQLDGERGTPADDIYSFGATLYELITSKPPFFSGNVDRQIREKIPPSMMHRRLELEMDGEPIDQLWENLVADCLQKDPAGRPQSIIEILGRLTVSIPQRSSWFTFHTPKTRPAAEKTNRPATTRVRTKTKTIQPKRESKHTFRRAGSAIARGVTALFSSVFSGVANYIQDVGDAVSDIGQTIADGVRGVWRGLIAICRAITNAVGAVLNACATAVVAIVRGIGLAIVIPVRLLFRGIAVAAPVLQRGVRTGAIGLSRGSEKVARNLGAAVIVLTRETLLGTAITILPAALLAGSIWFIANRPPPKKSVVQQAPVTIQSSAPAVAKTPPAEVQQPKLAAVVLPQATIAPPAPTPRRAALSVKTNPPGAKIILDGGSAVLASPATLSDLTIGQHHLQIVMDGYLTEEKEVEIKDGEPPTPMLVTLRVWPQRSGPLEAKANETTKKQKILKASEPKAPSAKNTSRPKQPVVAAPAPKPSASPKGTPALQSPKPNKERPKPAFEGGPPGN